jgi:hypothetical protein
VDDCGVKGGSLLGAMRLYQSVGRKLKSLSLTKLERRRLVEQRRCLIDVFGPEVRLDPKTFGTPLWEPNSTSLTVKAPKEGALLVLVGKEGRPHKTFFIPFQKFATGTTRVSGLGVPYYVYPGAFGRSVDANKLADELIALAKEIRKTGAV